jgi:hypothetical protein
MYKKLFFCVPFIMLINLAGNLQAEPFSLGAVEDIELGNDAQIGPDASTNGSGLGARDIPSRRRVVLISYDISELKSSGEFSNVSFNHFSHDQHGETNVYGVIESLDLLEVESLTWNTAPSVQNNPTPALDAPVELDIADLTDILLTFSGPGSTGVRFSTDTSQALADFLNSDTDGIITLLFAPSAENNQIIVRSSEHSSGGSLIEGEITPVFGTALNPNPDNEAEDVPRDVVLSWTPGESADKHDVYLGEDFEDVNDATPTVDPNGVYKGRQDPNYYPATGKVRLELGKTYYWRIDEIDMPQGQAYPGPVWSFTVEPFSYPIDQITATASSKDKDTVGPENTINGSGLDETGLLHGNDVEGNMWLSSSSGAQPTWIEYEFEKAYKLHEMWVWNFNGPWITHFGLKNVKIEYSADGSDYATWGTTHEFAQATGEDDYTHNTVNLDGVTAKYIRITANSNWSDGTAPQYGLSEVRFFYIPIRAREPSPDSEATDVDLDVTLSWRVGCTLAPVGKK